MKIKKKMAQIPTLGKESPKDKKENPLKGFWDFFLSQDKFTRSYIVVVVLIIAVTLFIAGNRGIFAPKAEPSNIPIASKKMATITVPLASVQNKLTALYNGRFFSVRYQSYWNQCTCGKEQDLESFQLSSWPIKPGTRPPVNSALISFSAAQVRDPKTQTYESQKKRNRDCAANIMCTSFVQVVNGNRAAVSENTNINMPVYSKKVWIRKNNIIYTIILSLSANSKTSLAALKTQYLADFDAIVWSFKPI